MSDTEWDNFVSEWESVYEDRVMMRNYNLSDDGELEELDYGNIHGWELDVMAWNNIVNDKVQKGELTKVEGEKPLADKAKERHSNMIQPVPLFYKCLDTLQNFFEIDVAPEIQDRTTVCTMVGYGFVDASKGDLGSMVDNGNGISYRIGVWGSDGQDKSSNWREFSNLVETLEQEVADGSLENSTLVMATDNSTAEACFYKGNSSSELLYNLVVRIRILHIKHSINLYITHMSGRRMQGHFKGSTQRGSDCRRLHAGLQPLGQNCLRSFTNITGLDTLLGWRS